MGWVEMSERELRRAEVLASVFAGRLTMTAAAGLMGVTRRQAYRLARQLILPGEKTCECWLAVSQACFVTLEPSCLKSTVPRYSVQASTMRARPLRARCASSTATDLFIRAYASGMDAALRLSGRMLSASRARNVISSTNGMARR